MAYTTHAVERAAERYGLEPTEADWSQAVLDIIDTVAGDRRAAILLRVFANGFERWLLKLCGADVVVVYNPVQALIVTVALSRHSSDDHQRAAQGRVARGRPVERRQTRWRFTSDEHIA